MYSFNTLVTLLFCHCEEYSDEAISLDLAGNEIATPDKSGLAMTPPRVVARSEITRLHFGTGSAIYPSVFARSIATKQSRWTWQGMRLPRPDKSGLAMTPPSCLCEADFSQTKQSRQSNDMEDYYPMLQTYYEVSLIYLN